jgi:hypothetical protein
VSLVSSLLDCSHILHKNADVKAFVSDPPLLRAVSSLQWLLDVCIFLYCINWLCKRDVLIPEILVISSDALDTGTTHC